MAGVKARARILDATYVYCHYVYTNKAISIRTYEGEDARNWRTPDTGNCKHRPTVHLREPVVTKPEGW